MLRLVVVLPLRPLHHDDSYALRDWPPHLTVVPTFVTGADLGTVTAELAWVTVEQGPLQVRAGGDEGFGRRGTIPVTVIDPSAALIGFHGRLLAALATVGATFDDPDFIGAGYRPHVTITRAARVSPGTVLDLRQVAVVDMAPEGEARVRPVVWVGAAGATGVYRPRRSGMNPADGSGQPAPTTHKMDWA